MTQDARSAFQNALREALDTYYVGWQVRFARDRASELPDSDTLKSWVYTDRNPQYKTFTHFIAHSEFPVDIRDNLLRLYQQLPPRTRKKSQPSNIASDTVEPVEVSKYPHMTFIVSNITTVADNADLAGYSKQNAIIRDSEGNLTVFVRYQSGELAFVRKENDSEAWSEPTIFDQTTHPDHLLHVAAAIDSADDIHVVWGEVPEASDAKYGLLHDTTWIRQEIIGTGTFARNIAIDSANHPHVVWTNVDLSHSMYNGRRWLGPKSVGQGYWHPDILIDRNDDVYLFVNSAAFRPEAGVTVYALDNTLDRWNAPVRISTSQFWSGAVAAAMSSREEIYAAWIGTPTADGGEDQVFFSRRIEGNWQSPFPIGDVNWAASSTGQESPAVAFDANDVFYVFWRGLNTKNRPMTFCRAFVPENSALASYSNGWSQIISLDVPACFDVWWASVADGRLNHRTIGVDVVWRGNKGRSQIVNYAHVTFKPATEAHLNNS